jgi:hypothetical protein
MPRTAKNKDASAATTRRPPRRRTRASRGRPSVDREWHNVERTLRLFERLREAAARERRRDPHSPAADDLEQLAWAHLREADPVRLSHAEKLLDVSNQTVRAWLAEGALTDAGGSPRRVGLESVLHAKRIADELREQGKDRDFLSVVLSRADALGLEDDEEFRESRRQMRRGERRRRPY